MVTHKASSANLGIVLISSRMPCHRKWVVLRYANMTPKNLIAFASEVEAKPAGFIRAGNCSRYASGY